MKRDLFICPECGADLIKSGIREIVISGVGETQINFTKEDEKPIAIVGQTSITDFDDQYVICDACGEELHDRTASDIVAAYENNLPHEFEDEFDDDDEGDEDDEE